MPGTLTTLRNSRIFQNLASLVFLKGFDYIVPLLLIPFLFRTLGVEAFGLLYFSQAFINYFLVVTRYGFDFYITHYLVLNLGNKNRLAEGFSAVITSKLIISSAGFLVMLAIINSFDVFREHQLIYILYYGIVLGDAIIPTWFFQAMERMKFITYTTMASRIISTIPMFVFVRSGEDVWIVPACYSVGSLSSGVIAMFIARRRFDMPFSPPPLRAVVEHTKKSSYFFLTTCCTSIQSETGIFLLGLVGGNYATGIFAAAQRIVSAYNGIVSPFQMVLYPYMIRTKNLAVFGKIFKATVTGNALIVTAVLVFTPFIIKVLFNSDSVEMADVMRIIMIKSYVTMPVILLGFPLIGALISNKYVINTNMVCFVFYMAAMAVLYFSGAFDVYTLAIITCVSDYLLLAMRVYILRGVPYISGGLPGAKVS